jgi:hypothetical protein
VTGVALAVAPLVTATAAHAAPAGQRQDVQHAVPTVTTAGTVRPLSSWFSGTIQPGDSQNWVWNNAPTSNAFKVGLSPSGASTTANCQFEVTHSVDVQKFSGEREFHFTIENVGTIACGTTIELSSLEGSRFVSTGGIDAGGSLGFVLNSGDDDLSYLPGVDPTGATSSADCRFEVTETHYQQLPGGQRQFHFTVKNVGTIACSGTAVVAQKDDNNTADFGTVAVGSTIGFTWQRTKTNLIYFPGLDPVASASNECKLAITRMWYQQRILADGSASRDLRLQIKNIGSIACSGSVLFSTLDAND